MAEADHGRKGDAGKDLIRAIFGTDDIAEDSVRYLPVAGWEGF
jgi:hypothetical protein